MRTAIIFLAVLGVALSTPMKPRSPDHAIDRTKLTQKLNRIQPYYPENAKEQAEEMAGHALEFCDLTEADVDKAIDELVENIEKLDTSEKTVCKAVTENLMDVARPITSAIDTNCNKNHNLGNFAEKFLEGVVSVVKHVCETDGEHLLELMNPCLLAKDDETAEERIEKCMEGIVEKYQPDFESEFKDKTMVAVACGAGKELYEQCMKPELSSCKLQITKDSISGFADALLAPCA